MLTDVGLPEMGSRWPESCRKTVAALPGCLRRRRGHGEARLDSANTMLALALAGRAPDDGVAWILAADAR